MIRISATTLEQYRRMIETEYTPEQEIIDSVMGKPFVPRWQMKAGSAWHDVLAMGDPISPESVMRGFVMADGSSYEFSVKAVKETQAAIGPGLWEVKATKIIDVWGVPVELVAKADHVNGETITDIKAKFSTPDARDYEPSLQWRAYLHVHDASSFRYILCDFADPKQGYCELRNLLCFRFWRYAGLGDEMRRWLGAFLDWAHTRRLTEFLHRESHEKTLAEPATTG